MRTWKSRYVHAGGSLIAPFWRDVLYCGERRSADMGVRGSEPGTVTDAEAVSNCFDLDSETRRSEFMDQSL
jgi:hypothetical protein